jgi:hypothetical protein
MKKYHSEDLGTDGRVILKSILESFGWIHLPQDRDQWRAFVNTVMGVNVP